MPADPRDLPVLSRRAYAFTFGALFGVTTFGTTFKISGFCGRCLRRALAR